MGLGSISLITSKDHNFLINIEGVVLSQQKTFSKWNLQISHGIGWVSISDTQFKIRIGKLASLVFKTVLDGFCGSKAKPTGGPKTIISSSGLQIRRSICVFWSPPIHKGNSMVQSIVQFEVEKSGLAGFENRSFWFMLDESMEVFTRGQNWMLHIYFSILSTRGTQW